MSQLSYLYIYIVSNVVRVQSVVVEYKYKEVSLSGESNETVGHRSADRVTTVNDTRPCADSVSSVSSV